jgi:hypothetical protein
MRGTGSSNERRSLLHSVEEAVANRRAVHQLAYLHTQRLLPLSLPHNVTFWIELHYIICWHSWSSFRTKFVINTHINIAHHYARGAITRNPTGRDQCR